MLSFGNDGRGSLWSVATTKAHFNFFLLTPKNIIKGLVYWDAKPNQKEYELQRRMTANVHAPLQ